MREEISEEKGPGSWGERMEGMREEISRGTGIEICQSLD
jgi:hypothetical protein